MKIASIIFGGGISTLGMSVITSEIYKKTFFVVSEFRPEKDQYWEIKKCDVLLVSLNWYEDILEFMNFLDKSGIDPKKKKPIVIIGGIGAINIQILHGMFNYCVLGDGETTISDVILAIKSGSDPSCFYNVISDGDFASRKQLATSKLIPASIYEETRTNRTTRIELARGCRFKCPFCQIGNVKPYREQPIEIVKHLINQSKTKNIGLFAPDRTGYSKYPELELYCSKVGKINTAQDARLDMLMKYEIVNKIKFGLEGFRSDTREKFNKMGNDAKIIEGFSHIFKRIKTNKGKPLTVATVYMIGDLPGENESDVSGFWKLLEECSSFCDHKFTLFLTLNSFSAKPFTPMEFSGIRPYNKWNLEWSKRPRLKNVTIASRGGMKSASSRIIHALSLRGDVRLRNLLFWIATNADGKKIYKATGDDAGLAIERLIKKQGIEPASIYGELPKGSFLPHHQFSIEPL